jgi:hypothetical protein
MPERAHVLQAFSVVAPARRRGHPSSRPSPARRPPAGAIVGATEDDILRFKMPTVTVTAQKDRDRQKVPVSDRRHPRDIDAAGIRW